MTTGAAPVGTLSRGMIQDTMATLTPPHSQQWP